MPREKYRVHEVAKDFGTNSKAILEILAKISDEPKKHSTVLYSCEAVEEKIAESSQLDAMVSDIIKNVKEE